MTVSQWASTLAALTVVLTFIGGVGAWIFKKYADQLVSSIIKEYLSELKPNSGSTMRDDIKEMKRELSAININMARLEGRFVQHLAEGDYDSW